MKLRNIIIILIIAIIVLVVSVLVFKPKVRVDTESVEIYEYFTVYSVKDTVGVIDKKGNEIIKMDYTEIYIPNPQIDVFICFTEDEYVILNSKGDEIFEMYSDISPIIISEYSLEMEKNVLKYEKDGLYGLVNLYGESITEAEYEEIASLKNKPGFLLVKKDGNYGVMNSYGEIIIDIEYNSIRGDEYCSEEDGYNRTGYIVSTKKSDGIFYGYIDYKGKVLLQTKYESIYRVLEYNQDDIYLIVMSNGKKGVFKNKKNIIKNNFQDINYSNLSKIFTVERNRKIWFL